MLRKDFNLPKAARDRQYMEVPELPMGYQAQVDFGQAWLHRPNGSRILAVDENFGDVVYTEEFQNYINLMRFKTRLCRAYDPEIKGKAEAVVKFVKYNFAIHRVFVDIDSFNEDCLKWLDRTGNGKVHDITKKVPAEVLVSERQYLQPVPQSIDKKSNDTSLIYSVRKNNIVFYKQNRYQVPKGTYEPGKQVKLVLKDNSLDVVDLETGEIIAHHVISSKKGELVKLNHPERHISKTTEEMYFKALTVLDGTESAKTLLDNIRKERSRYAKDQLGVIVKAASNYDEESVKKAIEYCVSRRLWSAGMFKDTLEHFSMKNSENSSKKPTLNNSSIPSKCKGVKTEIRAISEYIMALKEDNREWKN